MAFFPGLFGGGNHCVKFGPFSMGCSSSDKVISVNQDSISDVTNIITSQSSNVTNIFQNNQTINIINYGNMCPFQAFQTNNDTQTIVSASDQTMNSNIQNELFNEINQAFSQYSTQIAGFLNSTGSQMNSADLKNYLNNIVTTNINTSNNSSQYSSTLNIQTFNVFNYGTMTGSNCIIDQTIIIKFYASNLLNQLVNAVNQNTASNQVFQQLMQYLYNEAQGLFAGLEYIAIIGVVLVIALIILAIIWWLMTRSRRSSSESTNTREKTKIEEIPIQEEDQGEQ